MGAPPDIWEIPVKELNDFEILFAMVAVACIVVAILDVCVWRP